MSKCIPKSENSTNVQVIMNQKKAYDMLKLQVPERNTIYLKLSSDEIPQVKVICKRDGF